MTTDLLAVAGPDPAIKRCARCGSSFTRPVLAGGLRNEICLACGACWYLNQDGEPVRVETRDCEGCEFQAVCLAGSD